MLGKIKEKLTKYIDSRIANYFSNKEVAKDAYDDISMAQAEAYGKSRDLVSNLKYSFQKDFSSLSYKKEGKTYSMDSIDTCIKNNNMYGMTGSPKDIVFTFFAKFGYIGWQICSVLAQHWLVSNACSISNKDCIRNGWNNIFVDKQDKTDEEDEKDQETLNKLYDIEQQEYGLNDKLLKFGYYRNVFGTAYLLPKIDGIEYDKPYNPDGIKKGSFKGISVIEPYWIIPEFDLESMTDPTSINFFEPEYYRTSNGQRIHRSHIIVSRRKYVSDILKPSYMYGGISLAQEIYERVYASEKCANEAPLLLLTKRLNVYKIELKKFFANPSHYEGLAKLLTETRDNQGILFADHNDEISQIDTTLSDLDEVIMKQYQLVSAIARIPADKLFETNPTGGLSASGDYNIKNYNQDLNTLQTDVFTPAIDRINEIVMRSYFDKKDRVSIIFNPTDNPTEKEIAELNSQKANTIAIYLQNNIITPEEARQKIVNDKMSGFGFLKGVEMEEPNEEDIQEIENIMEEKEVKDEDDIDWITVKGNHIPVKEGVSKKEAVKEFIENKEKSDNAKIEKRDSKSYNNEDKKNKTENKEKSMINQKIHEIEKRRTYENEYGNSINLDQNLREFKKEAKKYAIQEKKDHLLDLLDNDKDKFIREWGRNNIQEVIDAYNADADEQIENIEEALNNDDIISNLQTSIENVAEFGIEDTEYYNNIINKYLNYINDRIEILAEYLKKKGYKVDIGSSSVSESNYVYLKDKNISIRLAEHSDRYGSDINLKYSDSIEKNIEEIESIMEEKEEIKE